MRNNKKVFIPILIIITVIAIVIGSTYAWYQTTQTGGSNIIKIGEGLSLVLTNETTINITDSLPMTDEYALTGNNIVAYTFSLVNQSDQQVHYDITIEDIETTLPKSVLRYAISVNGGAYSEPLALDTDSIHLGNTLANTTTTYSMKIWVAETTSNDYMNATYSGRIIVTLLTETPSETVTIANTSFSIQTITPDFNKIAVSQTYYDSLTESTTPKQSEATVENGLFKAIGENELNTYYFRGAVTDNYVKFGSQTISGTPTDLIWRIVRINEDGTIRMILNTQAKSKTNAILTPSYAAATSSAYHLSYSAHLLKPAVENWYQNSSAASEVNLLTLENDYIADTVFCNDRSGQRASGMSWDVFAPSDRLRPAGAYTDVTPTFICPEGYELTLKVGVSSMDEVIYAGNKFSADNISNYLYHSSYVTNGWWTMSASMFSNNVTAVWGIFDNNHSSTGATVTSQQAFRPIISLKTGVLTLGTGTIADPFRIG